MKFSYRRAAFASVFAIITAGCASNIERDHHAGSVEDSPAEVVADILKASSPLNSPYVPLTNDLLANLRSLLCPSLADNLTNWIETVEKLESSYQIPWNYNPLTQWKYFPDSFEISGESVSGNDAQVTVIEKLDPGKIYNGYVGTMTFDLRRLEERWQVCDIIFTRHFFTEKELRGNVAILLSARVVEDIKAMEKFPRKESTDEL